MTTYTYRAFDHKGIAEFGSKNFKNKSQLEDYLNKEKLFNYTIFKSETNYSSNSYKRVSPRELSIFCRQMSVLFFSHITLMEGISLLSEQTENKQLQIALIEIHNIMSQNYTFTEAVSMYPHIFGNYLITMTRIGETSGTLDIIFSYLSDYFYKEYKVRKRIRSAVSYPLILTILMGTIILLLILKILPIFQDILLQIGGEIPKFTRIILSFNTFLNSYFIIFLMVIIFIVFFIQIFSKSETGKTFYDTLKMSLPTSKYIYSRIITARLARALSILLKSGIQLLNSLEEVKYLIDNKSIREKFEKSIKDVRDGASLSKSLENINIFPPIFIKMLAMGEYTGRLDEMLEKSADMFDEDVNESLERLTVIIEPILIIILSIIVAVILVSVMLPMIDIMNSIG